MSHSKRNDETIPSRTRSYKGFNTSDLTTDHVAKADDVVLTTQTPLSNHERLYWSDWTAVAVIKGQELVGVCLLNATKQIDTEARSKW